MVIVVNTRLLLKERLEGIGWFTYETMSRITRDHPEHRFIFVFDRPNDPSFIFSDNVIAEVVSPPTRHPFLWYMWFDWRIPSILKKHKADLFISTDGYLSTRTKTPQLAVIHDLNFVHRPKDLPFFTSLYYNRFFPVFARKACRIATVSTYSKNDIVATYGISPSKIDIVWSGRHRIYTPVEEPEQKVVRQKYTGGAPYFVYIGSLHPRKNVDGLLTAFDQFKRVSGSPVKLVIVGGKMFKTGNISKLFNAMEYRDEVIFTGRIPVEEVRLVLGSALAVTFVPFFEGFGLPLTEGMSAGVPVICSNTTALPEIGGNAALFTDPYQPALIADAMKEISTNEALRKDLIAKGHIRKEEFTWDLTADLLWKSIEKAFAEIGKPI